MLKKGKAKPGAKGMELDDMLDAALDEFEEMEMQKKMQEEQAADQAAKDRKERSEAKQREEEREARAAEMQRLLAGVEDPSFGPTVQSTLKALSSTAEGNATVDDLFASISNDTAASSQRATSSFLPRGPDNGPGIAAADVEVTRTLKMLADAQRGMAGFEAGRMEEAGEGMMEDMMAQFEALGEKEDYNEVIDGVMRQLLSKDLM